MTITVTFLPFHVPRGGVCLLKKYLFHPLQTIFLKLIKELKVVGPERIIHCIIADDIKIRRVKTWEMS